MAVTRHQTSVIRRLCLTRPTTSSTRTNKGLADRDVPANALGPRFLIDPTLVRNSTVAPLCACAESSQSAGIVSAARGTKHGQGVCGALRSRLDRIVECPRPTQSPVALCG